MVKIETLSPRFWKDYELIDCGSFEKLERFGNYYLIRPEPQAVWDKNLSEKDWAKMAHARFSPQGSHKGRWDFSKPMKDPWTISYPLFKEKDLVFKLSLTSFKHFGIFPEQSENWEFIKNGVQKLSGLSAHDSVPFPTIRFPRGSPIKNHERSLENFTP